VRERYLPNLTLRLVDPEKDAVPGLLEGKGQIDGQPTVYVCHRQTCSPPATDWAAVERLLA
jgi:uncharacterized protein YyaL (SSP411 family)